MALRKRGQKDSGQYSVYNPPTSNLDLLRTRGDVILGISSVCPVF